MSDESEFKPCGHSALGCYNSGGPCCDRCDHATYWREIEAARAAPGPHPDEALPMGLMPEADADHWRAMYDEILGLCDRTEATRGAGSGDPASLASFARTVRMILTGEPVAAPGPHNDGETT
jgi:hypothetical protein